MPQRRTKRLARMGLIGGGLAVSSLGAAATAAAAATPTADQVPSAAAVSTATTAAGAPSDGVVEADGSLWSTIGSWGAFAGMTAPAVGWAARPGGGAWEVTSNGGVLSRGGAPFFGSLGGKKLGSPIVAIVATATGNGYWLFSAAGGVFTFGDAAFHGSAVGKLGTAVAGAAATPNGAGYWVVTAAGGVLTFGDAPYHGGMVGKTNGKPVVGVASSPTGNGYWLASSGGAVFTFGDAAFAGSAAGLSSLRTLSITANSTGYDLVRIDGTIDQFRPGASRASKTVSIPASEVAASEASPASEAAAHQSAVLATAVAVAQSELGKPYVYGAAGPNAFDCSGLTEYAFAAAGVSLPHNAAEQYAVTDHITAAQLQPGDLVFFYPGIQHVGIYIGNGEMIDAPNATTVVRVDQIAYFGPLEGASDPAA